MESITVAAFVTVENDDEMRGHVNLAREASLKAVPLFRARGVLCPGRNVTARWGPLA